MSEPRAYYNEYDKFAAAWLRNLIAAGHIAPGDVDERDIRDVRPSDLASYIQCHFFAGIGVWSHALRRAGWPDHRPVWTASCPCQPFSQAGKGGGVDDERHLWPAFFHLVEQCGPSELFGEQVASKDGLAWLDLVQSDMEGTGHAFAALDLCAAGFGAPHIRQRLYWLAYAADTGLQRRRPGETRDGRGTPRFELERLRSTSVLADDDDDGFQGRAVETLFGAGRGQERNASRRGGLSLVSDNAPTGPINGIWQNADWLLCRDGKWRPVRSGTFPLAHGAAARVGRLRAYGNAIVAPQAEEFIGAYLEADAEQHLRLTGGVFA